jgi:ribosomal protein S18 acetylase RimI-like enzyme
LLSQNPSEALGNYTWINNVTVGAYNCDFAFEGDNHCLAYYRALPFPAISLEGDSPALVARLAEELISAIALPTDQSFYSLVPERIATILTETTEVLSVQPEWQMAYNSDPGQLNTGTARPLEPCDLPAMTNLAHVADAMVFDASNFAHGDFFGVDCDGELVAMGGVQTRLPGFAEIGSIATHPAYRRRGYASQVVAALVHHLRTQGQQVFLVLFQTNHPARALYEKLGFHVMGELKLMRWRLANQKSKIKGLGTASHHNHSSLLQTHLHRPSPPCSLYPCIPPWFISPSRSCSSVRYSA